MYLLIVYYSVMNNSYERNWIDLIFIKFGNFPPSLRGYEKNGLIDSYKNATMRIRYYI